MIESTLTNIYNVPDWLAFAVAQSVAADKAIWFKLDPAAASYKKYVTSDFEFDIDKVKQWVDYEMPHFNFRYCPSIELGTGPESSQRVVGGWVELKGAK